MSKKLYINQLEKKYRITYLHNPKHFFLNYLWIENLGDGRKILCANPRPHNKNYHRLALLKPLHKQTPKLQKFVEQNTVKFDKPFGGIFTDK